MNLEKNSYIISDLENKIRILNEELERKKRENLDLRNELDAHRARIGLLE